MSRGCAKARGRLTRFGHNILVNILRRGLPRPIKDVLIEWAEKGKRVELWICEEDSQ